MEFKAFDRGWSDTSVFTVQEIPSPAFASNEVTVLVGSHGLQKLVVLQKKKKGTEKVPLGEWWEEGYSAEGEVIPRKSKGDNGIFTRNSRILWSVGCVDCDLFL
jgi:hypothetical protein